MICHYYIVLVEELSVFVASGVAILFPEHFPFDSSSQSACMFRREARSKHAQVDDNFHSGACQY